MKSIIAIVVILAALAGVVYFVSTSDTTPSNSQLPEVTLLEAGGNETSISSIHEGEVLVINSWATWCPFCVNELPDLVRLQEEYGERIKVIAVNRRESIEKSENYLESIGAKNSLIYLYDSSDSWYRSIGGFSMPETLFVATDGTTVVHKRGFMDLEEMREHVETTLAK